MIIGLKMMLINLLHSIVKMECQYHMSGTKHFFENPNVSKMGQDIKNFILSLRCFNYSTVVIIKTSNQEALTTEESWSSESIKCIIQCLGFSVLEVQASQINSK